MTPKLKGILCFTAQSTTAADDSGAEYIDMSSRRSTTCTSCFPGVGVGAGKGAVVEVPGVGVGVGTGADGVVVLLPAGPDSPQPLREIATRAPVPTARINAIDA